MCADLTSDNLPLSEPTLATTDPAFAVDCNPSAAAYAAGRFGFAAVPPDCDDAEVLRFLEAAASGNTRRAYRTDLAHFLTWGGKLPADPGSIARYLDAAARRNCPCARRERASRPDQGRTCAQDPERYPTSLRAAAARCSSFDGRGTPYDLREPWRQRKGCPRPCSFAVRVRWRLSQVGAH